MKMHLSVKREKMKSVCLAMIFVLGLSTAFSVIAAEAGDGKPNVIYVMLDDAGYGDAMGIVMDAEGCGWAMKPPGAGPGVMKVRGTYALGSGTYGEAPGG